MYPEWVERQRKKGTNISCIDGRYYLYEVTSVYNHEKKRAQKITKRYLGRITEDGLVPPKTKLVIAAAPITVKEYGAINVLIQLGDDILSKLKEHFGNSGVTVFAIAAARVVEQCPFKRVEMFYQNSFLSEILSGLNMSPRSISEFMRNFGGDREALVAFMREFIGNDAHIIFDGTGITSQSAKMGINRVGYNAHGNFDPQINLLYAFSRDAKKPVYYRIVAGNVRDVTALSLTLKETGLQDTVVVADKGFGSDANFKLMDAAGIRYVVPLRRNSTLIDADRLKTGGKAGFDGYFMYAKRPIWYFQKESVTVFLDDSLRVEEEKAYLLNIENDTDGYTKDSFLEKSHKFGIIALYSNTGRRADEIYNLYKERGEIEQTFDFLKNLLEQDKSYMQNPKSLEAWAFINHISLLLNYKIFNLLREKKLLSKYSVADVLFQFKYIHKIKIDSDWVTSESTKKTRTLLKNLGLHIT